MKVSEQCRILLAVLVIVCLATPFAAAQERQGGRVFFEDPNPAPAVPGGAGSELVQDGGFEAGSPNPFWTEASTNFGTPLCTVALCGMGGGTGPFAGSWWAWFGGISAPETGSVEQTVQGGANDTCTLSFQLEIPVFSGNGTDFVRATIGGTQVFQALESTAGYGTYAPVSVDVSNAIDGSAQILRIESTISGSPALTNFFVDDVSLTCQAPVPALPRQAMVLLLVVLLIGAVGFARLRLS
jgi:hypothetical protein